MISTTTWKDFEQEIIGAWNKVRGALNKRQLLKGGLVEKRLRTSGLQKGSRTTGLHYVDYNRNYTHFNICKP